MQPEVGRRVAIVGGGASGMIAAIAAARAGAGVTLLERNPRLGKKLLATGNGRCNFTNLHARPANFLSRNPRFCISALSRYTAADFIGLVERHGIAYHEKTLGQLFCDGSSRQIVDMLLTEMRDVGAELRLATSVDAVRREGEDFALDLSSASVACSSLVIATRPSFANKAASALSPALGVVSNLSPVKIELAPARKQSACVLSLMLSRPADSRTIERGIVIRATATVRTNSMSSIFASGVPASMSPSTVPFTGTRALIGTLSGWAGRVASACRKPTRSSRVSPMPTIPPQQTAMPEARTASSVSSRS